MFVLHTAIPRSRTTLGSSESLYQHMLEINPAYPDRLDYTSSLHSKAKLPESVTGVIPNHALEIGQRSVYISKVHARNEYSDDGEQSRPTPVNKKKTFCITLIQRLTAYECYTDVLCLLGHRIWINTFPMVVLHINYI